jgi:hypothetical protein
MNHKPGDLKSPNVIILKGMMFLFIGIVSTGLLLVEFWSIKNLALLLLTIWGFCRFYYFAFYVIQHYVDDRYQFAGLGSFFVYLIRRIRSQQPRAEDALKK